jgi:hypothetical protein
MARRAGAPLASALLCAAVTAAAQPPPGTSFLPGVSYGCSSATPEVERALQRLRRAPYVRPGTLALIDVDLPRLHAALRQWVRSDGSGRLALRVMGLEPLRVLPGRLVEQKDVTHWTTGTVSLQKTRSGALTGRAPVVLTLAQGGRVRGAIDLPGQGIRIEPLGGRCHAVFEANPSGLPQDHPDDPDPYVPEPGRSLCGGNVAQAGCTVPPRDPEGNVVVSVAVAFTDEAAEASATTTRPGADPLAADAAHWVQRTNEAFIASGIKVRLSLASTGHRVGISEKRRVQDESPIGNDPARLAWRPASRVPVRLPPTQGVAPASEPLSCWWSRTGANLLVLMVKLDGPRVQGRPNDACGKGKVPRGCAPADGLCGLLDDPGGAPGTIGYAWVRHACANASHAFAHEVGHLLGADHETSINDPPLLLAEPSGERNMGYAYTIPPSAAPAPSATRHATLMGSYGFTELRVPVFSTTSPAAVSPVDGESVWGDEKHDNARVIEAVAAHMAARAPPPCGPLPPP